MPALRITDYATLTQAIALWLNRTSLTDQIPTFIQLAERQFRREIRWRGMIEVDDIAGPAFTDEMFEILPDDMLELKSIRFTTNPEIRPEYVSPQSMAMIRARNPGATGVPTNYTIIGNKLWFDRVPTGAPGLEIMSYVAVPALTEAATTNVLLVEAPDIYLFGALMQAETFLKNDPRLATWTALYQNARDALMAEDRRAERSPGPLTIYSRRQF